MALKFIKAGVAISSSIAKETILSKIINTINIFSIDIASKNFDDMHRKYIDTILKLDDSKTIMLETKGEYIDIKNERDMTFSVNDTIYLEYSSIIEHEDISAIFVNYPYMSDLPLGTIIGFTDTTARFKLIDKSNELFKLSCLSEGTLSFGQKIFFENYNFKPSFLSDRDKKNIIWGIQSGVNVLSAGSIKSLSDIEDIRTFLLSNNGQGMKIYARVSKKMSQLETLPAIAQEIDGITIHHDDWEDLDGEATFIHEIKSLGKPLIVVLNENDLNDENKMIAQLHHYVSLGVDVVSISEQFLMDTPTPLEHIQKVFSELDSIESDNDKLPKVRTIDYHDIAHGGINENRYLINLLPQIVKDTGAKIVLCYTTHGHTAAQISALGMGIPILTFTRDDFSYRYNNLLWGVKGYKIGQTSTYELFKQIGKEMIRIYFKGNISLDDKVVIVNILEDDKTKVLDGLINGVEIYKFKNI